MSRNSQHARNIRAARAIFGRYGVLVVHTAHHERVKQGLIGWKNGKLLNIAADRRLADGITEYAHRWVILLAIFCRRDDGQQYIKLSEIEPDAQYKADTLEEVMEQQHNALELTCNPAHVIGAGWIASPAGVSLSEADAGYIFEAVGAFQPASEATK